ncbi:nibrin [Betta splendens]|uniref:Nibrin n=1 Tax=Betta splendens TaxID=158456 RepID=A0A6P7KT61_BETSP|nr:nibrin [Betta splendens]
MWILTSLQPGGQSHHLLSSKDYIVGRKNCDILLPNDQSISRAHAVVTATDQTLTVKDTSKYGTFVNSQRVETDTPVNVSVGDIVTFGVFDSKFSVDHQKTLVCSSCLDNDGKASLSQALVGLGGKLVNTWSQDCTHLIMPTVKVTVKTISALLCCRPIVRPEFFSELHKAVQQKLPLPKAESFLPEIDEPSLNKEDVNLGVISARRHLFTQKTFIFLNARQLKRLSGAVGFGGGSSRLLEEGSLPRDLLESPQSCVVDVTTANSQTILPPASTEWANSVKNIVQRKGLRVITESEIGLAAIYASCDKYCNPSSLISDTESVQKVKPRIPSASLSQTAAVEETVLPAASQNITTYAVNTELSEGRQSHGVTEVTAVGETPEKKQKENSRLLCGAKLTAKPTATQCVVAETMSSSLRTVENTNSQKKKPESRLRVPQLPTSKTNGGMTGFLQKQSPQKQKLSAQTSPQKQSTLTSFFQAVNKKRPLEDECSTMSEPKRSLLESSISVKAPDTSVTSKETYSHSDKVTAAALQTSVETRADLFTGRSDMTSHTPQEEPGSRKRKDMEAEIEMDELMSLMSEDMDCFEEQAQLPVQSSAGRKQLLNTAEASSLSKRQRVHKEENVTSQKPLMSLEKDSSTCTSKDLRPKPEQHIISIKEEPVHLSEYGAANPDSSKCPERSSNKNKDLELIEEDNDPSFIEDADLLEADICQPKEETKTPLKPVTVKQEAPESQIDENLPKKLILVEFRSLTVGAPPRTKPKPLQSNSYTKNFKCFRKNQVPGAAGLLHIIGGSDLLVHNRGKNSDLDEWMKDAAEEERQSRQDETVGDDLFRYNPTKLTKRR